MARENEDEMSSQWPSVSVVSAYRFHMFELAGQLAKQGALGQLLTTYPSRFVPEVPSSLVLSRPWLSALQHAFHRLRIPARRPASRSVIADFDRWAARKIGEEDVVTALSSFGTKTMQVAAARGASTVCDRGSWHILEQKQVLDAESDRLGWPRERFDSWIVDRELVEYELVDRIHVPSEVARQSFLQQGIPSNRVLKVPYGVDISMFSSASAPGDALRIISVGTIGMQKGHHHLLGAYRKLRRPGSSLVLVGPARRDAVERLDVGEPDIQITGPVSRAEVAAQMRRSGIFALASIHDGLALVIGQAMASGLPIVATSATGAAELVTDGKEGLIVPPGDKAALVEALDELIRNPELAREMGKRGRRKMELAGGWDHYGQTSLVSYRSLVDASKSGLAS